MQRISCYLLTWICIWICGPTVKTWEILRVGILLWKNSLRNKLIFQDFPGLISIFQVFQAWILNFCFSRTFQVFKDPYEPWTLTGGPGRNWTWASWMADWLLTNWANQVGIEVNLPPLWPGIESRAAHVVWNLPISIELWGFCSKIDIS